MVRFNLLGELRLEIEGRDASISDVAFVEDCMVARALALPLGHRGDDLPSEYRIVVGQPHEL